MIAYAGALSGADYDYDTYDGTTTRTSSGVSATSVSYGNMGRYHESYCMATIAPDLSNIPFHVWAKLYGEKPHKVPAELTVPPRRIVYRKHIFIPIIKRHKILDSRSGMKGKLAKKQIGKVRRLRIKYAPTKNKSQY